MNREPLILKQRRNYIIIHVTDHVLKAVNEMVVFLQHMVLIRAANSHALSVSLTHFTTFSRSHADMLISHTNFFFFFLLVRGL